jgi:hypothetical protein
MGEAEEIDRWNFRGMLGLCDPYWMAKHFDTEGRVLG